jgi:hypothetical protein
MKIMIRVEITKRTMRIRILNIGAIIFLLMGITMLIVNHAITASLLILSTILLLLVENVQAVNDYFFKEPIED